MTTRPLAGGGAGRRRAWPRHCLQLLVVGLLIASVVGTAGPAGAFAAGNLTLVSSTDHGGPGSESDGGAASSDGTIVAFESMNRSLGEGDTDTYEDIYVKNTVTGALSLASTSDAGVKGNNSSVGPVLSADGRRVAFTSYATNLGEGDTDADGDIYVKDLVTGALTLASTSDTGTKGNASSDGAELSADGTKVMFDSGSTNLVPADTDTANDIYVKDLTTGALTLADTSATGTKANGFTFVGGLSTGGLSADGTHVAFSSAATNLTPADTDTAEDIYVKNLTTGALTLASTSDTGTKANGRNFGGSLSADGTKVSFSSLATNLGEGDTDEFDDVYVKNLTTGALTLASVSASGDKGNSSSGFTNVLSADGTKVAFSSIDSNLTPADTDSFNDFFVKNLTTGAVTLADTSDAGTKSNNMFATSGLSWMSPDGTKLVFSSPATNLGEGVTKNRFNMSFVYEKDLQTSAATVDCAPSGSAAGLTGRFSNLPPNETFLLLSLIDGSGAGGPSTTDGTPITTDSTGSASGPATLVPSNILPVKVGYIVYRDYNANQQWNDQRDDAVYRGTATVTSCPSTVAASPK